MGMLVDGKWHDKWYDTKNNDGAFKREAAKLRNWVTADGRAGPTGAAGFKAEAGRYHLYVSLACPWAHRTLIFRKLKSLVDLIDVSVVATDMLENGWTFDKAKGSTGDHLFANEFMHQVYSRHSSTYSGRVTVPVLWDKHTNQIVSNESADIIRMFNSAFDHLTGNSVDYYPPKLQAEIDQINAWVYDKINNGVYRCGFATSQKAYELAFDELFSALARVEDILSHSRYLTGEVITEADWRLFTTLVRFDAVYHGHFKCNGKTIADYPNIAGFVRELFQLPGIAGTINFDHIKRHYYYSHIMINPSQIIPKGLNFDFKADHNRAG